MDSATSWECDTSNSMFIQSSVLRDTNVVGPALEIQFLQCQSDTALLDERLAVYQPITYAYGSSELKTLTEGVVVKWTSADGTVYTSRRGTGANQDFSFKVLTIDTIAKTDTTATLYLLGTMDLVLYNSTIGLPIESGEFRMKFGIKK